MNKTVFQVYLGFPKCLYSSSVYDNFKAGFHCNASISVRRMHKGKEDFNIVKLLFYVCVYACASKSVMLTLKFTAS